MAEHRVQDDGAGGGLGFGPGTDKDIQQPLTLFMPVALDRLDELKRRLQDPRLEALSQAALDKVGTVHATRFVILEDDERRWAKIGVIAIFDGTFEDYIKAFAREMSTVFNALLECVEDTDDKPSLPIENDVAALIAYIRKRDVKPANNRTYSAYPDQTTLDVYEATRPRHYVAPSLR